MKVLEILHNDHGLLPCHVEIIQANIELGFFIKVIQLQEGIPSLPAGLYGPLEGDQPQTEVFYKVRGTRSCASRFVNLPMREGRFMVVIGFGEPETTVIYTAYGSVKGVVAAREPGDLNLSTWEEVLKAREFWAEHALSVDT